MNILVTGANGQLGNEIRLRAASSAHHYIFSDVNEIPGYDTVYLDITCARAMETIIADEKVDIIINCAAYSNVDGAEDNPGPADKLNHVAAANIAGAAYASGALVIHISTDYVFGGYGSGLPYREDAMPSPTSVYGRTKLLGEQAVMASGCRYLIFRTAWLYSGFGKNFLKTMLSLMEEKAEIKVVSDQIGTPTYARDLAGTICELAESGAYEGKYGIYNYTGEGACSWYDFAVAIRELSGHPDCNVLPCRTGEYPSKAARPAYSVLDKTKIKETFGVELPCWTEALRRCLEDMKYSR